MLSLIQAECFLESSVTGSEEEGYPSYWNWLNTIHRLRFWIRGVGLQQKWALKLVHLMRDQVCYVWEVTAEYESLRCWEKWILSLEIQRALCWEGISKYTLWGSQVPRSGVEAKVEGKLLSWGIYEFWSLLLWLLYPSFLFAQLLDLPFINLMISR